MTNWIDLRKLTVDRFKRFPQRQHPYFRATAFHLYETYGLPLDFMVDAARDQGLEFDLTGFEAARAEEQARARASWKGGAKPSATPAYRELPKTTFEGYTQLVSTNCEVLAIVRDGVGVPAAAPGEEVEVVLDHTSFYADSGGQVGDHGWLRSDDHNTVVGDVLGCTQPVQGVRAHRVQVKQPIALGMRVDTVVDAEFRNATRRNHTGTHLLHAALRQVLGTHVKQAGSLVSPSRLRFDFSHFSAVADEELQDIEDMVNRQVLANTNVVTLVDVPIDVAVNEYKAMALFGEKYGERVRVVKIGDFSTELCGGTHTGATGEIGLLKLTGESSVSSGVRRVEAVSGMGALGEFRRGYEAAQFATHVAGASDTAPAEALRQRFTAQEDEIKRLRRELDQARMKSAASSVASAADQVDRSQGCEGAVTARGCARSRPDAHAGRQLAQQARLRRGRARFRGRGWQSCADRWRDQGPDQPRAGGKDRGPDRAARRRLGRRTARPGRGRRQGCDPARCCAGRRAGGGRQSVRLTTNSFSVIYIFDVDKAARKA